MHESKVLWCKFQPTMLETNVYHVHVRQHNQTSLIDAGVKVAMVQV